MDLKKIILSTAVATGVACVAHPTDLYFRDGKPRITCIGIETRQRVCTSYAALGIVSTSYTKAKINSEMICAGKEVIGDIWRELIDYGCDSTVDFYRHGDKKNLNMKKDACRTGNEEIFKLFDAELAEIKRDVWRASPKIYPY